MALSLTRRIGETIIIGENMRVTVLAIKGKQVRLGTDAPDDVSIHREEVFERIKNGEMMPREKITLKNKENK